MKCNHCDYVHGSNESLSHSDNIVGNKGDFFKLQFEGNPVTMTRSGQQMPVNVYVCPSCGQIKTA